MKQSVNLGHTPEPADAVPGDREDGRSAHLSNSDDVSAAQQAARGEQSEEAAASAGPATETTDSSTTSAAHIAGSGPPLDSASPQALMKTAAPGDRAQASELVPTWTRQRIVLLGQGGPRLLEVQANVDGVDLLTGLNAATKKIAHQLELDFKQPPTWESLLDKPLIRSGWLGNLVPTEDQRPQLFSLYDTNKDQLVSIEEFQAFLTRGLSRSHQLRVVRGQASAPLLDTSSPWGPIDRDADGELSAEERRLVFQTMLQYDFDGDRIITAAELQSVNDMANGRMVASGSRRFLDVTAALTVDAAKPAPLTQAIFEHYTFTETIPLDAFFSWPQSRLTQLDADGDGQLTQREVRAFPEGAPDCLISATFPNSLLAPAPSTSSASISIASVSTTVTQLVDGATWVSSPAGGRVNFPGCVVTVHWTDAHDPALRVYAERQLAASLENPQLSQLLVNQFDLKDGALEMLRQRGDKAGEAAWEWLVAPRHWHLTIAWTQPDAPWFELLDANGDQRLVAAEFERFEQASAAWDLSHDGLLQLEEMPLVVVIKIARDDTRQSFLSMGGPAAEKRGANTLSTPAWFIGMDYNSDGELTKSEFLGEEKEFESLDKDGDGIIGAREVYVPH